MNSPNQTTVATSKQFSLNWQDILKGLLMAVGTAVLTAILPLFEAGSFHFNWTAIGSVAGSAATVYLLKNFLSPSQIVIQNPSKQAVEAVKDGVAEAKVITPSDK